MIRNTKKYFLTLGLLLTGILIFVCSVEACNDFTLVSRKEWKARPAKKTLRLTTPVKHEFVAHTVTPECQSLQSCSSMMRSMQTFHMDKQGFMDIGYNFVVGGDGRIYEGTGWTNQGIHIPGWNSKSHGIAFIGNYMSKKPNEKMLLAVRKLMICGITKGYIAMDRKLHGARDATCTKSPGDVLYGIIQQWPMFEKGPLNPYNC
ncbi:peptidoglycan-recognition protein 1-like [Uloborus diversus]|uniref:peptidoglycan-recognition protein 1-like n=1 Tax=Uloborus diversus TaxID=327109 RepID=UPI00240A6EEF|nr:peptidoglycan-recognition protein 1-like [Uloborus diversus]